MRLDELLGIEHPLIQAPMAGVQDDVLALAVCRAGALGSVPCAMLSAQAVEEQAARLAAATDRPFNLNFFCHDPPAADASTMDRWAARLGPLYEAMGIDGAPGGQGPSRNPFDAAMLAAIERVRPAVVSFHFGLPEPGLLQRVKATGARVLSSATTVDEARWLESRGADVIIAQGLEAGGHRGHFLGHDLTCQSGTLALLPQVVAAVRVPVVAAGGIASAAGVRAALALGASGVQVGTAFLLCDEARTSEVHRRALRSPEAAHTAITNVFTGRPARAIVNRAVRELGPVCEDAPPFPLAIAAMLPLRQRAEAAGSGEFSSMWAGQNVSGCAAVPAADLVARLMAD